MWEVCREMVKLDYSKAYEKYHKESCEYKKLIEKRIEKLKQRQNNPISTYQYQIFDFEIYVTGNPVFGDDEIAILRKLLEESKK